MSFLNKTLIDKLHSYDLTPKEKMLWVDIKLTPRDSDGYFYLSQREWAENKNITVRALQRQIRALYDHHLIDKQHRTLTFNNTSHPINGGGGKFLFVKSIDPETEDNMMFFGKFHSIENEPYRMAVFRDVYNLRNSVNFKFAFCDLEKGGFNSEALEKIDIGHSVVFNACIKRREKKLHMRSIWNIRPAEEYYADGGN